MKPRTVHFWEILGTTYLIFKLIVWFWDWIILIALIFLGIVGVLIALLFIGSGGGSSNSQSDSDDNPDDPNEPYHDIYPDEGIYWDEYNNDFQDDYHEE